MEEPSTGLPEDRVAPKPTTHWLLRANPWHSTLQHDWMQPPRVACHSYCILTCLCLILLQSPQEFTGIPHFMSRTSLLSLAVRSARAALTGPTRSLLGTKTDDSWAITAEHKTIAKFKWKHTIWDAPPLPKKEKVWQAICNSKLSFYNRSKTWAQGGNYSVFEERSSEKIKKLTNGGDYTAVFLSEWLER